MKANELMIGDWVSMSETEDIVPCVVTALHPEDLFVIQPGECAGDVLSYDTIYPIPLTPEILEKNEWEKEYISTICVEYTLILGCCDIMARITNGNAYLELSILHGPKISMNIHYVHELQHALRLCGLNGLADNFKV